MADRSGTCMRRGSACKEFPTGYTSEHCPILRLPIRFLRTESYSEGEFLWVTLRWMLLFSSLFFCKALVISGVCSKERRDGFDNYRRRYLRSHSRER